MAEFEGNNLLDNNRFISLTNEVVLAGSRAVTFFADAVDANIFTIISTDYIREAVGIIFSDLEFGYRTNKPLAYTTQPLFLEGAVADEATDQVAIIVLPPNIIIQ